MVKHIGESLPARASARISGAGRRRRRSFLFMVVGLCIAFSLVWQSTDAAFVGKTGNEGNELRAGTVVIADADSGRALFTATGLAPGATDSVCVGVTYTGTIAPSAIRLYFSGVQESDAGGSYSAWADNTYSEADDNLTLDIEINDADLNSRPGFNDCNPPGVGSFVDITAAGGEGMRPLIASRTDFANGLSSRWNTVAPGTWRVFKFTYRFSPLAPDSAQGDGLEFAVVWEAQS